MEDKNPEYTRGYQAAQKSIAEGEDPQTLFNQSYGDDDQFSVGWQRACTEKGAVDPSE